MNICERHGRLRCGECSYIEELENQVNELRKVLMWLENRYDEELTYESGTGDVVEEIIQKIRNILN